MSRRRPSVYLELPADIDGFRELLPALNERLRRIAEHMEGVEESVEEVRQDLDAGGGGEPAPLGPPPLPLSVAGSDQATRRLNAHTGLTETLLRAAITMPADHGATIASVWLSLDGGVTWETDVIQDALDAGTTTNIEFYWPAPQRTVTTARFRVTTANESGWNAVEDAVESADFTIAGAGVTRDYSILDAAATSPTYALASDGAWYWGFSAWWTNPSGAPGDPTYDPNFYLTKLKVVKGRMVGGVWTWADDYEGMLRQVDEFTGAGRSVAITIDNNWTIPPAGSGYTFRVYLYTVNVTNVEILQTQAWPDGQGGRRSYAEFEPTQPTGAPGSEWCDLVSNPQHDSGSPQAVDSQSGVTSWIAYGTFTEPDDAKYGGCRVLRKNPANPAASIEVAWVPKSGDVNRLARFRTDFQPTRGETSIPLLFLSVDVNGRQNSYLEGTTPELVVIPPVQGNTINLGYASPGTLATAAFAAGIRPVALAASLPTLPDSAYPAGSLLYHTSNARLYKVQPGGTTWDYAINGGLDIIADSITGGQIAAGAISTTELFAGELLVGGGGGKPTRFRVNDSSNNPIAFIGEEASPASGVCEVTYGNQIVTRVSGSYFGEAMVGKLITIGGSPYTVLAATDSSIFVTPAVTLGTGWYNWLMSTFYGAWLINLRVGSDINKPNFFADSSRVYIRDVPITAIMGSTITTRINPYFSGGSYIGLEVLSNTSSAGSLVRAGEINLRDSAARVMIAITAYPALYMADYSEAQQAVYISGDGRGTILVGRPAYPTPAPIRLYGETGIIHANQFYAGAAAGQTTTINYRKSDGVSNGTMTFTGGILTGST